MVTPLAVSVLMFNNFLLKDFLLKGLQDKDRVNFCSPPVKTRPTRLYFLKKIHKNLEVFNIRSIFSWRYSC